MVVNADDGPDFDEIASLIAEWQPALLVVGMPAHADGSPSEMQEPVAAFMAALAQFELPVEAIDERFTSVEAQRRLKEARIAGARGRIRKEDIDAASAVLIAEQYLRN